MMCLFLDKSIIDLQQINQQRDLYHVFLQHLEIHFSIISYMSYIVTMVI